MLFKDALKNVICRGNVKVSARGVGELGSVFPRVIWNMQFLEI
jgi:hypothetical protein